MYIEAMTFSDKIEDCHSDIQNSAIQLIIQPRRVFITHMLLDF